MADEPQKKWGCEYCTFKNWEAAKKCTICQAPRPPKFITESHQSQDIYQVASLAICNQDTHTAVRKQNTESSKWSCTKCTYLNWAKTKKCIVCSTRKPSSDASGSIVAALEPLTINTSSSDAEKLGALSSNRSSPSSSIISSNRTSPSSTSHEASNNRNSPSMSSKYDTNNDRNRSFVSTFVKNYQNKWNCKICTYENWPKASKCIICGTLRSPSTKDLSLTPSLSPVGALQQSPPNSPRGATASIPSNKAMKKSDTYNSALQKIHDKFSEIDWLWLKACIGTFDGDRIAVDAYLACSGDVARQLTVEEANLIGDGTRFQKGHTLLHLALQSQREDVVALLLTASVTSQAKKRLPPHTCPDLANEILRTVACSLRQRKGDFPSFFFTECVTFALPGGKLYVLVAKLC